MWNTPFMKDLCEPHHIVLIAVVFIIALIAAGAGKGLGGMIASAISKWKGGGNTINIGGAMAAEKSLPKECEGCGLIVDPSKCVMHQSEHERSKRNEAQILSLWEEYGKISSETRAATAKLKDEMNAGFKEVTASIADSNKTILGALAGSRSGFGEIGKGGRD